MKNALSFCFVLIVLLLVSCQQTNSETIEVCNDCKTASYESKMLKIGDRSLNMSDYKEKNVNDPEFFSINTTTSNVNYIAKFLSKNNFEKTLKGIIIFSNHTNVKNNLDESNIDAFAVYEQKVDDNVFNVRMFKKNNGVFEEHKLTNLETSIISTNDFKNISLVLNNNNIFKKTFAVINFKNLRRSNLKKFQLQDQLHQQLSLSVLSRTEGERSYCGMPCDGGPDSWCTAQESFLGGEQWFCLADVRICFVDQGPKQQDDTIEPTQRIESTHNVTEIRENLYSFRDNYLTQQSGGTKYVEMYYSLSENLDYTKINQAFLIDTFDLLEEMSPKLLSLVNNKNSTSVILIDDDISDKLNTYLINYRSYYTTSEAQNNIDFIISKINEFKNQNNQYITTHL